MRDAGTGVPRVAVVVVGWNHCELTLECLASLDALTYPRDALAVILVDNGSTDGAADAVRTRFPRTIVQRNAENLGFAAATNIGIRLALDRGAARILLLNNDTVVEPGLLEKLLLALESGPRTGIAGPKMLYHDRPGVIWAAGNRIDWRNGATRRLGAEEIDRADAAPVAVDFISGCALMFRREAAEEIGLLDERFFLYYEETDWCARAARAGWGIVVAPAARIRHRVSATAGATSPATDYYYNRNRLLFLAKNLRGVRRGVALGRAAVGEAMTIIAYSVKHAATRRRHRDARLLALRDAALGRWGKMGADVERACFGAGR